MINAPAVQQFENTFTRPSQTQHSQSASTEADVRTFVFDDFEIYDSTHVNSDTQGVPLSAQQHPLGLDPGELGPIMIPVRDQTNTTIISDEESPSLDDTEDTIDDRNANVMKTLMNFKLRTEDERCRRTIIYSNLSFFKHESWHNGTLTNFWPRFRNTLRAVELGFILRNNEHVKLCKSGALRITYDQVSTARSIINELKATAARFKSLPRTIEDDLAITASDGPQGPILIPKCVFDARVNLKFCMATPPRHHKNRKILEKLAKKLKNDRKIVSFDFIVHGDHIFLKTLWKQVGLHQSSSSGLKTVQEKYYTNYTVEMAKQILSGSISVTEREHRNRHNRLHAHGSGVCTSAREL